MKKWLSNFAYHTPIPVWIFLASGLLAMMISFVTISYHSVRLANKNPADTLHYE
jgi:putative ABC transport system permease protein